MFHPEDTDSLDIESLDLEGQGVGRRSDGKVVFVEGALPSERVLIEVQRRKPQWEQATAVGVLRPSTQRVVPRCRHFGLHAGACGGCKLQHLDPAAQVAVKQRVLEDHLAHLAKVHPQQILRPLQGPSWGYRHRARLSVRYVAKKDTVLVGFHERKSRYVADMTCCEVLPAAVSALLLPLRRLVGSLQTRDRIPQIEVAVGDALTVLVLRHLQPLPQCDQDSLRRFAQQHGIQWWLQPQGPSSAHPLDAEGPEPMTPALVYRLSEFGLSMAFSPTDFTQVNAHVNERLVSRAVRLLEPAAGDRVIDWFCGLGNFSLPIATRAAHVLGVEGSDILVQRAQVNARRHGLEGRAQFVARDLFAMDAPGLAALGPAQRWLVDPPRDGAFALVKALTELAAQPWSTPRRIVYVSCNPATLARDAGLLVHRAGYQLTHAGVLNMFAHTAHVESLAVFDRA